MGFSAGSRARFGILPPNATLVATIGPEPPLLPVRAVLFVLRWSPVWVPALLIWLISGRGLKPALAEQKRLDEARAAVVERYERSEEEYLRLKTELEAWQDPTYVERRRRALAAANEGR